jgi:hypothetical protein
MFIHHTQSFLNGGMSKFQYSRNYPLDLVPLSKELISMIGADVPRFPSVMSSDSPW